HDEKLVIIRCDLLQDRQNVRAHGTDDQVDIVARYDLLCNFTSDLGVELVITLDNLDRAAGDLPSALFQREFEAGGDSFSKIRIHARIGQNEPDLKCFGPE